MEDELTGLHNRRSFMALLRRHVLQAVERQSLLAVVVVDLDGFARLNAAHGYDFGDAVLRHMADVLRQLARPQDYVARIGNDRFALILTRLMNQGHAALAVQKLFRQLESPFTDGRNGAQLHATVGVAVCPAHATHAEFLLRQAEQSLAIARNTGQSWGFPATEESAGGLSESWDLEIDMHGATERGEMFLRYQPKLAADNLRPIGAEALMRWQHRSRGLVPPALFIPVAEQSGQIRRLTVWALNTALRQASEWEGDDGSPLSVAVNVPADMVVRDDLPDLVENALRLWGRPHTQLMLEITERSLVVDPTRSFKVLSQIREQGVKISIDDFGTGYSCLAYFKDIPADELKIDKSFVSGLLTDPACADITSLIVDLAHRFGLNVVAEGVEDEATLAAVRARGCDTVQGYLFAEALPQERFCNWLREQPSPA